MSLVAERAVRVLRDRSRPMDSVALVREVLSTRGADERTATRILEAAFGSDPRLRYGDDGWSCPEGAVRGADLAPVRAAPAADRDRVLLLARGEREVRRGPFKLREVAAVRLSGGAVVGACGGVPAAGRAGEELRREFVELARGAVAVMHDEPGSLGALERWLGEPLESFLSLRELACDRLGVPAGHDLELLAGRLGVEWRTGEDLLDRAEALDACLDALTREGESLHDLQLDATRQAAALPWSRYSFDRGFLRSLPKTAGTYRFFDGDGNLLYVGRTKNLHARLASYFREGKRRSLRVQALLDALHHIEIEPLESDLEAMLQEAADIARRNPSMNVQRHIRVKGHHRARMRSIMILEPAAPPLVLRAYLLRDGRFIDKIGVGPRGGGLRRMRRLLDDHFFSIPDGPSPATGPDLNMELVGRWLASNRDRVVAFDPTSLRDSREVTERIRELLSGGALLDPDGAPIRIQ